MCPDDDFRFGVCCSLSHQERASQLPGPGFSLPQVTGERDPSTFHSLTCENENKEMRDRRDMRESIVWVTCHRSLFLPWHRVRRWGTTFSQVADLRSFTPDTTERLLSPSQVIHAWHAHSLEQVVEPKSSKRRKGRRKSESYLLGENIIKCTENFTRKYASQGLAKIESMANRKACRWPKCVTDRTRSSNNPLSSNTSCVEGLPLQDIMPHPDIGIFRRDDSDESESPWQLDKRWERSWWEGRPAPQFTIDSQKVGESDYWCHLGHERGWKWHCNGMISLRRNNRCGGRKVASLQRECSPWHFLHALWRVMGTQSGQKGRKAGRSVSPLHYLPLCLAAAVYICLVSPLSLSFLPILSPTCLIQLVRGPWVPLVASRCFGLVVRETWPPRMTSSVPSNSYTTVKSWKISSIRYEQSVDYAAA